MIFIILTAVIYCNPLYYPGRFLGNQLRAEMVIGSSIHNLKFILRREVDTFAMKIRYGCPRKISHFTLLLVPGYKTYIQYAPELDIFLPERLTVSFILASFTEVLGSQI